MPQLLYIDLNDGRASTSLSAFAAPVLYGVQGSPVTYDFAFHDSGTIRSLALGDAPKLILQLASAVGGSTPRVIGNLGTASGSGTGSRYRCSLVADNASVRADFAAEASALVYELQLNWRESSDAATRRTQGITLNLDVARDLPNTATPNPVSELEDADLYVSNRAICYDREQTLSNGQRQQALDNLGLSDSLSYRPGVIAVNSTQIPGVRTEPTLQSALDTVAANPDFYRIIEIIDQGTHTAASAAINQARLKIIGSLGLIELDLRGSALANALELETCKFSYLKVTPPAIGSIVGTATISALFSQCVADSYNFEVDGAITISMLVGSGIAPSGGGHGGSGINLIASGGCQIRASIAGAAGGDAITTNADGGNGGFPGNLQINSRCDVALVLNGNIGGAGGAGDGTGVNGADNSATVTVVTQVSAFSGFLQET